MAPTIEIIHAEKLSLGEGPHWDHEAQVLYYVDILESTVFKYDPSTKNITRVIVGELRQFNLITTFNGHDKEEFTSNLDLIPYFF